MRGREDLRTDRAEVAVAPRSFCRSSPGMASRKLPWEMAASSASMFLAATKAATTVAVSTVMMPAKHKQEYEAAEERRRRAVLAGMLCPAGDAGR